MRLDPDAIAILHRVRDVPPWRTFSPEEGRIAYRARALLFDGPKSPVNSVTDTTIPLGDHELPIRIYRPDGGPPRPIFIYLHGGGWTLGDLDTHDAVCRRISVAADCLVVAAAYRLAPEFRYQAQLDDVAGAVRWLADHGDTLGGDPTRLALGGDSAGGNLTAGVSIRLRDEDGPRVALQALIYAAVRPYFDTLSYHVNAEGYWISRADVIWFWDNFLGPDPRAAEDPYACPGTVEDLRGLPPAVVITAGFDPLRDEGEVYAMRLAAAGVRVHARRFPGMIHGFVALPEEIPAGHRAIGLIASAARRAWSRAPDARP